MLYHNVRVMAHYLRAVDAASVVLASAGMWWAGATLGLWDLSPAPAFLFSAVLAGVFSVLAGKFRVYHARRTEHIRLELWALAEVALYAVGVSCVALEVFVPPGLPGPFYAITLVAATALLLAQRLAMRIVIRRLRRRGRDFRVWLVLGRNPRAARLAEGVLANPHFGIRIGQIVDIASAPGHDPSLRLERFRQPPLSEIPQCEVPGVEAVRGLLAQGIVDEVVVTLPLRSHYDVVCRVLAICGEAGISVKLSTDTFEPADTRAELSHVGSIPMVTHFSGPSDPGQLMLKRLIDVVGSGLALLLLSPLMLGLALLVKLGSRGPVFYVQTRTGLHGRLFRMVKFRTMVEDADTLRPAFVRHNETDGAAFKMKADPRITAGGRFLRRYHLDELPQLWNVLLGDMSLVGPRPLPPGEATGEEWWHRRRLSMPPGMTCLWQAEGDHKIPFRRWMELDLAYIDQWSVWLDIRVVVRTLRTLSRGSGW